MCVFTFSATSSKIFYSKKNLETNCHKCENVFMWSTCYSCRVLMELEISEQIFEKLKY
jgi:hypothetical protein